MKSNHKLSTCIYTNLACIDAIKNIYKSSNKKYTKRDDNENFILVRINQSYIQTRTILYRFLFKRLL